MAPRTSSRRDPAPRLRGPWRVALLLVAVLPLLLPAGCKSPDTYEKDADREVYELIRKRQEELLNDGTPFTIAPPADSLRQRILRGEAGDRIPLTFLDSLLIAAENSRDYQTQKERLYQAALDLTFQHWQFQVQTTGTGDGTVTGDGNGGMNTRSNGNLSFSRLLGTGARIVTNLGASIFRMLATGDGWDTLTNIGISFTQPLLRGSSPAIVEEPLTQAERNLVYQVRAFERFRRTFSVDVATRFYRLLETQDNVTNQEANVKALEDLRARNEALAEAGRLSDIQVDQARQDELSSRDNLIQIQEGFQQQLDSFKLFLGLPISANITLVQGEIEKLKVAEDLGDTSSDHLVAFAWKHRLDYLTDVGRFEDAKRQINVAADALRMGLDLQASINTTSAEGRPLEFRPERTPWSGGFTADLPLDRLPERNAYRSSLIAYEAAKRAVDLAGDTIQANIRDQLRQVRATRQTYQIQTNSVDLAARRVESTRLNLEAGRSSTRDVLESQRALLAAQNAATRALIDYSLTRLRLFNEAELLTVDKSGIIVDNERLADLLRT